MANDRGQHTLPPVVNRINVLILLLYSPGYSEDVNEPISGRTRLQKQTFLVQQQLRSLGAKSMYSFRPYKLGPLSYELYNDIEWLKLEGVVSEKINTLPDGTKFSRFELDEKGVREASSLLEDPNWAYVYNIVKAIKKVTNALDLSTLVESVHETFPEYVLKTPFAIERLLESFSASQSPHETELASTPRKKRPGASRVGQEDS